MAQIVVRNIPESVMDEFRLLAKRRGTSMENEVRELIAEAVAHETRLRLFKAASRRQLKQLRLSGRAFSDSAELVREDRDR